MIKGSPLTVPQMRLSINERKGRREAVKEKREGRVSHSLLLRGWVYTQLRAKERERMRVSWDTRLVPNRMDGVGSMLVTGPPDPGVALTHLFADLWLGVVSATDFYHGQKLAGDCVVKNLPRHQSRERERETSFLSLSFYPLSSAARTHRLFSSSSSSTWRPSNVPLLPLSLFFHAFITRPSIYTRLGRRHVRDAIALIAMHR